jgi:hypothetical protein
MNPKASMRNSREVDTAPIILSAEALQLCMVAEAKKCLDTGAPE